MCLPLRLARPDNLKKKGKKTPTSEFRNVSKELPGLNTLIAACFAYKRSLVFCVASWWDFRGCCCSSWSSVTAQVMGHEPGKAAFPTQRSQNWLFEEHLMSADAWTTFLGLYYGIYMRILPFSGCWQSYLPQLRHPSSEETFRQCFLVMH